MSLHPIFEQALRPFAPHPLLRDGSHWVGDDAVASAQIEHDKAVLSDKIYCLAMLMTDLNMIGVDEFIAAQCAANGIEFPPKRMEDAA